MKMRVIQMTAITNFKNTKQANKSKSRQNNLFVAPKKMVSSKDIVGERRDRLIDWITFYRRNMHRFVQHYLGIKLFPYQVLWIYMMSISDSFVAICSRAAAKTWLLGVFAIAKCILYPGSEIVVVALTKEQAGKIISEKIKPLANQFPMIAREIKEIKTSLNLYECQFHNGSVIRVVPSRDSARGGRASMLIMEEFRLIPKEILDSVIRPFLVVRQAPYLKIDKYAHLIEEPREVFISSAYHKSEWWFKEVISTIKAMVRGDNANFFATDLMVAIKHGIKTLRQIKREKTKMDEVTYQEEYLNIPFGESGDSYYKLNMFTKLRVIKKGFYPQRNDTYNAKKHPYAISKIDGELRILSCDVATRAGKSNDLTIIACIRLLPTSQGYHREVIYMESHSGKNTIEQTLRIKQIFYDFEADYMVLDSANAGISIYDQLGVVMKNDEFGVEYPAMTIMQHESIDESTYLELFKRTTGLNALPVIYPISATGALNSAIAVDFRTKLKGKMFSFLLDETSAEDFLLKHNKEILVADDIGLRAFFMNPYVQTTLLINECINLSMSILNGNIKLKEQSGGRKDRYSCISYANYFISFLDKDIMKEDGNDEEDLLASVMVL